MSLLRKKMNSMQGGDGQNNICQTDKSNDETRSVITPNDVLAFTKIADDYLCDPGRPGFCIYITVYIIEICVLSVLLIPHLVDVLADANVYDIDFTRFKIRDLESGAVLFEIAKPPSCDSVASETINPLNIDMKSQEDLHNLDSNAGRYVRYQFTPQFLKLKTVGATCV